MKKFCAILNKNKEIIFDILAIILIILFAIGISPKRLQNDTFYTVTIGKLISENGIDGQDHFSWHEGLPYEYPHWLYDFGMYHIYNLGGWDAIYISTIVFASILGICIYFVNSMLSKNKVVSFIVTIAVLYLIKGYIAARAQLVTFTLFILFVYNIERFIQTKRIKNAVALLIIHVLIANLHVAVWPFTFILYLPYIAEYLISEIIDIVLYKKVRILFIKDEIKNMNKKLKNGKLNSKKTIKVKNRLQRFCTKLEIVQGKAEKIRIKREKNQDNSYKVVINKNKAVRWLIVIMIIAIFTGLLTPLGKTPYTYTYDTMKGSTVKNINEHLPLTLIQNTEMLCTLIIILALVTFTKIKIRLSDVFMLGGLIYLMFSSRRQQSMFILIGSIAFVRMINELIKITFKCSLEEISAKLINKFTMFIITAIMISFSLNMYGKIKNDKYISTSTYPVEASEWILKNLDVEKIKLYNEYNYGSYLLYKGIPVFIDSRADLYAPEFNSPTDNYSDGRRIFDDFINCSNLGTYYGEIFEKYEITHVIVYKNSKVNMIITKTDLEKFKELYSDNYFVIYEVLNY